MWCAISGGVGRGGVCHLTGTIYNNVHLRRASDLISIYLHVHTSPSKDPLWCALISLLYTTAQGNSIPVRLGNSGLKVSRIILGCMSYGRKEWQSWVLEEEEGIKHIKAA